jgi:antitoxin PrlF
MHQHLTFHHNSQELTATLTSKGQVTIPAAVRKRLNLKKGDMVAFSIENGEVFLKKPLTLCQIFGSVQPLHKPENFEQMIEEAKAERAKRHP